MNNRLLLPEDVHSLESLINRFFEEGHLDGKFDPKYADYILQSHIKANTGFVIVAGDPPIGGISGIMYPDMATGDLCCVEWFWYVVKEQRGSSLGLRLLKDFETQAFKRGARRIHMMHLMRNDKTDSQLQALYEKRGYVLKEQVYVKKAPKE